MNGIDLAGPQFAILVAAGLALVVDSLFARQRRLIPYVALAGLALSAAWSISWVARDDYQSAFGGTLALDKYAVFFYFVFTGVAAAVVLASIDWVNREGRGQAEYYALILASCAGFMFLAASRDLVSIFIALELSSIPQYILAGWGKDERSSEAGLKYLLLGAIASAVLLYGMALLYGFAGTTTLAGIASAVQSGGEANRSLIILAAALLIAGFGFKMAVVPFQMWVPDVYQGAPTPVAAYLSVGSKGAAFAVVTRLFFEGLGPDVASDDWSMVFAAVAAASMTVGNLMAIVQTDIKRLLGFSSIAQAGNLMVGLAAISVAGDEFVLGASGILFFVAAYAFTNLGTFIAVIAISQRIGSDQIKDYAGMWKRSPVLAAALALCLISLTGIPPTAGFWAKLYLFNAGIRADLAWLVIVGVLNSLVSAYYYLGVAKTMFTGDAEAGEQFRPSPALSLSLAVATIGVFVFGMMPSPLIEAAHGAAETLALVH